MTTPAKRIPFLRPRPARLSQLVKELEAIEASGVYSNYGPVNERFERALTDSVFSGRGGCLTVANATVGLMLALREAAPADGRRRYALMPSFTFAAAGHAAVWAGLTPLLCDIDPGTWLPSAESEDSLLRQYEGEVACIVPYATFGNSIELERYERLAQQHEVGVVVDAAASLGSLDARGVGFGTGFPHAVVYSMHATKTFATAEGGVIYCADPERLARLETMSNFGFGLPRTATMAGMNAKSSEVIALLALAKLEELDGIAQHRACLGARYEAGLPTLQFQEPTGERIAHQFLPALLPKRAAPHRDAVLSTLEALGIGCRQYFSPHLAEQPYFAGVSVRGDLEVTDDIARRVLSLPMADQMTVDEVDEVCATLLAAIAEVTSDAR